MGEAILFAVVASSALPLGALIGVWAPPRRAVTAALLGFAYSSSPPPEPRFS